MKIWRTWAWMVALLLSSSALAETKLFTFHVGVNAAPVDTSLSTLRYADDDAARFFNYSKQGAEQSNIAVVLDAQSLERHPAIAEMAIVPRKAEIERALGALHIKMTAARDAGHKVELLFSYSGHGQPSQGGTLLTALDDTLSPSWLEEWVLKSPADRVHVFIDACHGAGVVEQRGMKLSQKEGEVEDVTSAAQVVASDVLERYPHVGMLIASPKGVAAHEWSRLEAGVFTHEVLSALSGAADINGDRRITYSEVASFISAANRKVKDPRARIRAISSAPKVNPGAPIVDLNQFTNVAVLSGRTEAFGHAWVETSRGVRLMDMHPLPKSYVRFIVPTDEPFYLITDDKEVKLSLAANQEIDIQSLSLVERSEEVKARGSVAEALHDGLFRAPFERSYYKGFVDSEGMSSVSFTNAPDETTLIPQESSGSSSVAQTGGALSPAEAGGGWLIPGTLLAGAGVGVTATFFLAGSAAVAFFVADTSPYQKPAHDAQNIYVGTLVATGVVGLVTAGVGAAGILLLPTSEE